MTSSAVLLVSGLSAAQAQDAVCPEDIDAFGRSYDEALAAAGGGGALSASEQAELFGLRTTAENFYRAGNLEMCALAIERAQLMLNTAIAPTALQPAELVGMDVRNSADEYLGEVEDITIDPLSGRIAYVLVEHGGFLGIGDSLSAVPWRSVTWAPGSDWLLLDIDEERLENAPRYDDEELTPQDRRAWLLSVHNYYGVEPYWQDNISSMALGGGVGAIGAEQTGAAEEPTGVVAVPVEVESVTIAETPAAGEGVPATTDPAAAAGGASQNGATIVPAPGEQVGNGDISALMDRIGELENRIEELSQQGVGDDLRQVIGNLQEQVQQLAEQDPGEEVQQAITELREQVQQLAQQGPGEEVRQAIAALDDRVRQLAESEPGQDVRQAIASLETRIEELADSGPGREMRQMMARMQAEIRELSGRPAESATPGVAPGAGAAMGAAPTAGQQVDRPAAGTQGSAAGSETIRLQRQTNASGQAVYSSQPSSGLPAPAAGGVAPRTEPAGSASGQATLGAAADPEAGSEPCSMGITQLEEDLAVAERQGIAIDEARNELVAAQAMLQRASEALCRAAIKRARDELVAQGFEPTIAN